MLYNLVNADDEKFKTIIAYLKDAYWPKKVYEDHLKAGKEPKLPLWPKAPPPVTMIKEIKDALEDIRKHICTEEKLYVIFSSTKSAPVDKEVFPFVDRFHKYFFERQWTDPIRDPADPRNIDQLLHLDSRDEGNYSKNFRDYYHFINVVMATARLIEYFSIQSNAEALLTNQKSKKDMVNAMYHSPNKPDIPDIRTFKLMLAAFYHDIGKTVVPHRHGMEGGIILTDHTINSRTTPPLFLLNEIVKKYDPNYRLEDDDLLFIADLLFFHDRFGTLSTGESGYLQLVNIVDCFKRYSLKETRTDSRQNQIKLSRCCIFDLWILNLADIIVSIRRTDKGIFQEKWLSKDKAQSGIKTFINSKKADSLKHDLCIAFALLDELNKHWDSDNISQLEVIASNYANRHVVERIRRLLLSSLAMDFNAEYEEVFDNELEKLAELSEANWNSIIRGCIQSVSEFSEFSNRLAWIGQMDYSLGFLHEIVKRALKKVKEEKSIEGKGPCTGWSCRIAPINLKKEFQNKIDAQLFASNYASTVIRILEHLLFREREINKLCNLEFVEATNRLTDEKIDKITSMEGPFQAGRAVQLILQIIFSY
ncbi:hypothetical protein GEOBC_02529 [Geobacteraceae bacterium]|nr:hypothetical protein GEOBC_02529 [Geobacteraceae bacterium]